MKNSIIAVTLLCVFTYVTAYDKGNYSKQKISPYDVTIVGVIKYADGLGRLPIGVIDTLKDDLKINFITPRKDNYLNPNDVPKEVLDIAKNPDKTPGNVAVLFDLPWLTWDHPASHVPNSKIKIAYSEIESDRLPPKWVPILNSFDAIVVTSPFLLDVYKKSGITKPTFLGPHGAYLENFLKKPLKQKAGLPFTFGLSAGFWPRKNQAKVIEAFAQEFGNKPDVKLKLHGRFGETASKKVITDLLKKYNLKNVEFIQKSLSDKEYTDFMASLDCYILLSKGEGFSVTHREALALGIPTIAANNTGQSVVCASGFARCVETPIAEPSYYSHVDQYAGNEFNCTLQDAREALRDVYNNYNYYLKKAHKGREWSKQYLYSNLKNKFLNFIKPKKIELGDRNSIEEDKLITNSPELYKKFLNILK